MAGRIAYYGNIVKDGLILDLDAAKLDSYPRTGTAWRDISGNSLNGTLINGPTYNSNNGGSIVFDGVDDYISVNHNVLLNFTNSLTLNIWCSSNNLSGYRSPLMKTTSDFWNNGFGFYQFSNVFNFYINQWDGTHRTSISKTTFPITNWVGTYDGANLKLYENGTLISTGTPYSQSVNNSSQPLYIGNAIGSGPYFWSGNIPLVTIYNRALTAQEVLQNYNAIKGRFNL